MSLVVAHGIGGVQDLPVPAWLFYYGGSAVLVLSFLGLGALWKRPLLERARERPLAEVLVPALRILCGLVSVFLLGVVAYAAAAGLDSPDRNIAPTFVYVLFWVGLPIVSVVFGNLWRWLSPWRAAADAVAWAARRLDLPAEAPFSYPERLGRWPAAVLLGCFTALELAYFDPSDSRALALAILLYSVVTWLGMLTFGREAWTENGEAFAVYLGFFSRIAPLAGRGRAVTRRPPLSGLTRLDTFRPGSLAFVAVMLGSTAFDGFSRTRVWQDWRYSVQVHWVVSSPSTADWVGVGLNVLGLLAAVCLVALTYSVAVALGGLDREHAPRSAFLAGLVPIAFAYVLAHYFSLLVLQGQAAIAMLSDPFGRDWDLFGTARHGVDLTLLQPRLVWYVQVTALVVGHVLGLVVAHDRALALAGSPKRALRSQYAMLALMILYTVGGMWILSRP
jgi:hypothetical protein